MISHNRIPYDHLKTAYTEYKQRGISIANGYLADGGMYNFRKEKIERGKSTERQWK